MYQMKGETMKYNENNFFEATNANFISCEIPTSEPDFTSHSGSKYWYTEDGVIRVSNRWGCAIASCNWYIDGKAYGYGMHEYVRKENGRIDLKDGVFADGTPFEHQYHEAEREVAGFAKWADFTKAA